MGYMASESSGCAESDARRFPRHRQGAAQLNRL
jgi:hypothetical protein